MGWLSQDERHEGYMIAEFADGQLASPVHGGGLADNRLWVDFNAGISRPADEVTGWRICCDCHDADGRPGTWTSQPWTRVAARALDNPSQGRVFAVDEDVENVDDREDVRHAAEEQWIREHVTPLVVLDQITTAQENIRHWTAQLTQAVSDARKAGRTWAEIGQAAGMTRQGAQDRWGAK